MKQNVIYKTLEELKQEAIDMLNDPNSHPARITRVYESLFGVVITHSAGEHAPDDKFKVVIYNKKDN